MKLSKWLYHEQSAIDYFLIIAVFAFLGLLIRFLYDYYLDSTINYCPALTLPLIYSKYISQDIPRISNSFFTILIGNLQSALIIFIFPFLLILIVLIIKKIIPILNEILKIKTGKEEKFQLDLYFPIMKIIIGIVAISWGYNTFPFYCHFKLLPIQLFLSQFLHAIIEILAFFGIGCLALISVDEMKTHFNDASDLKLKKIIDVVVEIIERMAVYLLIIAFFIIIAAIVETWISPQFLKMSFECYFQNK
jgi:uncharacterized membrane protein SpoIIM required for sporulation